MKIIEEKWTPENGGVIETEEKEVNTELDAQAYIYTRIKEISWDFFEHEDKYMRGRNVQIRPYHDSITLHLTNKRRPEGTSGNRTSYEWRIKES